MNAIIYIDITISSATLFSITFDIFNLFSCYVYIIQMISYLVCMCITISTMTDRHDILTQTYRHDIMA